MHDELRGSLARQGIEEAAYLKVAGKTEADLHADFKPPAEKRVKVLLVLSKIADDEGITISDGDVQHGRRDDIIGKAEPRPLGDHLGGPDVDDRDPRVHVPR